MLFLGQAPANNWHHVYLQESVLPLPFTLCCLRMTPQREWPPEVIQGYLKLLLWYSLRVPSGEMGQSISTLSFETHGCSKGKKTLESGWNDSSPFKPKSSLQPTDRGSPYSTTCLPEIEHCMLFLWFLFDNAGAWASSQTSTPGSVVWSLGRTCSPSKKRRWYPA